MKLTRFVPLVVLLLAAPQSGRAGGAYHACANDCAVQRQECLAGVREGVELAREECAGPRCRRDVRRQARAGRALCRGAVPVCIDCCRTCLETVDFCPGFSSGERVCLLDISAAD